MAHPDPHPSKYETDEVPREGFTSRETRDALGSEPNITGGTRGAPAEDFSAAGRDHTHASTQQHGAGADAAPAATGNAPGGDASGGADDVLTQGKAAAEDGNNFPGTNPHPAHTALGKMSGKGLAMPGRE